MHQRNLQSKKPEELENLADFRDFLDPLIDRKIVRLLDVCGSAFKDKKGNHPSQLVFSALAAAFRNFLARIDSRNHLVNPPFTDIQEISKAFDSLRDNIVEAIAAYYNSHQQEIESAIGADNLGIKKGERFDANAFYRNIIKTRKKEIFSSLIDVFKSLTIQKYLVRSLQPENLIMSDISAQACTLSGGLSKNLEDISQTLHQDFARGIIGVTSPYDIVLDAVNQQGLAADENVRRLLHQRMERVAVAVKGNMRDIVQSSQRAIQYSDNIHADINRYNAAFDSYVELINNPASPCDQEMVERLIAQLAEARLNISAEITRFNDTFVQNKAELLRVINAEINTHKDGLRDYQPLPLTEDELRQTEIYQAIERHITRLTTLRISESAVSLTTLERLRLQIVERLDRLEKESDLFAEKMIRAAIVEYNRHLREIDAIGKAFAVECDRQHTSQNLQWDKARETARQELVPAANEYISSQMYERFLSLELQKAKETIQATRREYAVNAARIIREVEEKASLADRELRAAGRQCGVMLNQMLNEQCAAEAQTQTHSVTELLTTLRSTVERLPVDQWRRRQVNLRDAGELRNLYQQRVRQARAPHLHDGPELVQHVQPKKPGFFRRHLGKLVGAGAGILLGAGLGAFAGFFLAPVTFGLSIPLFAALGAIAGGAVLGSGVGAGIGAIVDHCCRNKKTRVAPLPSPVAAAQEPVMGLSSQANILRRSGGAGPAHSPRAEQNAHSPQGRISPDIAPVAAVDKTFVPEAVGTSLALK